MSTENNNNDETANLINKALGNARNKYNVFNIDDDIDKFSFGQSVCLSISSENTCINTDDGNSGYKCIWTGTECKEGAPTKNICDELDSAQARLDEFGRSLAMNTMLLLGLSSVYPKRHHMSEAKEKMLALSNKLKLVRWEVTRIMNDEKIVLQAEQIKVYKQIEKELDGQILFFEQLFNASLSNIELINMFQFGLLGMIIIALLFFIKWK